MDHTHSEGAMPTDRRAPWGRPSGQGSLGGSDPKQARERESEREGDPHGLRVRAGG